MESDSTIDDATGLNERQTRVLAAAHNTLIALDALTTKERARVIRAVAILLGLDPDNLDGALE